MKGNRFLTKLFLLIITLMLMVNCSVNRNYNNSNTLQPTNSNQSLEIIQPTSIKAATKIVHQVLGRIFPDGFESAGVSCNIYTGSKDSSDTHFDVAVPNKCRENPTDCPVVSPVDGYVWEIYGLGNPKGTNGYVVSINLSEPPEGIEMVENSLEIISNQKAEYSIHLGHLVSLNPELQVGTQVNKGMQLASGVNNNNEPEPKVAFIVYIKSPDNWYQISPCSVANESSFCGVCYQYDGECLETNLNYPDGGVEWWNEKDPFWNTHTLSIP